MREELEHEAEVGERGSGLATLPLSTRVVARGVRDPRHPHCGGAANRANPRPPRDRSRRFALTLRKPRRDPPRGFRVPARGSASSNSSLLVRRRPGDVGSAGAGPNRTGTNLASTADTQTALASCGKKMEDSHTPAFSCQMEDQHWPIHANTRREFSPVQGVM